MERQTNPLTNLEETIRQHWRTYRPTMYAELEAAGTLEQRIENAADRTRKAVGRLVERGTPFLNAWEAVREEWAILPAEEGLEDEDDEFGADELWEALYGGDDDLYDEEEADAWWDDLEDGPWWAGAEDEDESPLDDDATTKGDDDELQ